MYKGSIQSDWQSTAEGQSIMQLFYNAKSSGRKLFGMIKFILHYMSNNNSTKRASDVNTSHIDN